MVYLDNIKKKKKTNNTNFVTCTFNDNFLHKDNKINEHR